MQACQESVSDPSDLIHSMKVLVLFMSRYNMKLRSSHFRKSDPLLVCDDACTYVSHTLQRYPIVGQLAYGEKRGCFEKPQEDTLPQENISCPDITPIELSTTEVNREAMRNPSTLVHPDIATTTRYVSGTRQVNNCFMMINCWKYVQPSKTMRWSRLSTQLLCWEPTTNSKTR